MSFCSHLTVLYIALATGDVLHLPGIDQPDLQPTLLEHLVYRDPVHAGGLKGQRIHTARQQPVGQRVQIGGHRAEFTYRFFGQMQRHGHPVARCPTSIPAAQGNTSSSRLRAAMASSIIVDERQRHGKRRSRLDLSNGMRLAPLANVADDFRTALICRLAQARTSGRSAISALPFAL